MEEKIREYLYSIGLVEKDVQYYIKNNYTLDQVKKEIEKINNDI